MAGGIQDLWYLKDGKTPSKRHGQGARWRVRWAGTTTSFRTKTAAENHWRAITDGAITPSGVTVGDLLVRWKRGKAGLSKRGYRACVDAAATVGDGWWSTPAQQVSRPEIQEWIAGLTVERRQRGTDGVVRTTTEPASASTRQKAIQALRGALQIAVDTGQLADNPADGVTAGGQVVRDHHYLTMSELRELADASGHYRPMILTLGTTGIRIGEAVNLQVRDVDVDRARIRVRSATTKTRTFREVPVASKVLGLLDVDRSGFESLFVTPRAKPVLIDNWRARVWREIAPGYLRIHDLRHTAASLAIASGADVKAVQRMLGHKSAAMTLDLYGHLWDQGLDAVADRLDLMLGDLAS